MPWLPKSAVHGYAHSSYALCPFHYAEGAYIHELKALNEQTPWRRRWQTGVNGCTYPTHSLGPILQWFEGERVTAVCAMGTGHHYMDPRENSYEMEDSVTMMCRLTGGALVSIRVDMLSDRPHNMGHHVLQGTDGSFESADGFRGVPKVWLRSRSEQPQWEPLEDLEEEFLPDFWRTPPAEALAAGHGGGDYWESGVANPHLVLADLIKIFHPDLLPEHTLHYYRRLP